MARQDNSGYLAQMLADPYDARHGTTTGYQYGCRCERCLEAKRLWKRDYYERKSRPKKTLLYHLLKKSARKQTVYIHGVGEVEI